MSFSLDSYATLQCFEVQSGATLLVDISKQGEQVFNSLIFSKGRCIKHEDGHNDGIMYCTSITRIHHLYSLDWLLISIYYMEMFILCLLLWP